MAYGLDIEEIYYTDHDLVDVGVLNTYKISLDLADEKNFQIESPEFVLVPTGFWYIQDTEYGGIIDEYTSDSDEKMVTYTGRSFRGILGSHILTISDDALYRILQGSITEIGNSLLAEKNLQSLFVFENPDVNDTISAEIVDFELTHGTSLYDALIALAQSIDFTLLFEFRGDKKIHITPTLAQDYTDFMQYSDIASTGFKVEVNTAVVNHLIYTAIDTETGGRRTIHFFADDEGGMQPYATTQNPIQDSDYILDNSSQVLFGIDEISHYEEGSETAQENYKLLEDAPEDWKSTFANYYYHEITIDDTTGEVSEEFNQFEAIGQYSYAELQEEPKDWKTNYAAYFTRTYIQDPDERKEAGSDYQYNPVSADTVIDPNTAVLMTKIPSDWKANYGEYYFYFQTGTGKELRPIEGLTKSKYVKMTKKPSDWDTNFGSYYRKVYEKITYKNPKKKTGKKVTLIDCVNRKDAKYVNCKADDDRKNGKVPSFAKRNHYRKDTYTTYPKYDAKNTYRVGTKMQAPTWEKDKYYSQKIRFKAPQFIPLGTYEKVLDHYYEMVQDAIDFFEDQKKPNSQTMNLDDFEVNIGDTVGGRDEFTGTQIVRAVKNINVTIENGLINAEYVVGD